MEYIRQSKEIKPLKYQENLADANRIISVGLMDYDKCKSPYAADVFIVQCVREKPKRSF